MDVRRAAAAAVDRLRGAAIGRLDRDRARGAARSSWSIRRAVDWRRRRHRRAEIRCTSVAPTTVSWCRRGPCRSPGCSAWRSRSWIRVAACSMVNNGFMATRRTPFPGVVSLAPATTLIVDDGRVEVHDRLAGMIAGQRPATKESTRPACTTRSSPRSPRCARSERARAAGLERRQGQPAGARRPGRQRHRRADVDGLDGLRQRGGRVDRRVVSPSWRASRTACDRRRSVVGCRPIASSMCTRRRAGRCTSPTGCCTGSPRSEPATPVPTQRSRPRWWRGRDPAVEVTGTASCPRSSNRRRRSRLAGAGQALHSVRLGAPVRRPRRVPNPVARGAGRVGGRTVGCAAARSLVPELPQQLLAGDVVAGEQPQRDLGPSGVRQRGRRRRRSPSTPPSAAPSGSPTS